MPIFAHITGIPHHSEEAQSLLALWPLVLLALQLIWAIAKQRVRQVVQAALQGLREARPFFAAVILMAVAYAVVGVARGAPAPVVLRDSSARVLGSIETSSDGVQTLRNAHRRVLGTYSPRTNETRDASNRLVGSGNLLASLLRN